MARLSGSGSAVEHAESLTEAEDIWYFVKVIWGERRRVVSLPGRRKSSARLHVKGINRPTATRVCGMVARSRVRANNV